MTNAEDIGLSQGKPGADVAEQQIPVDINLDETGLDLAHRSDRSDANANPADLTDQAISVPFCAHTPLRGAADQRRRRVNGGGVTTYPERVSATRGWVADQGDCRR